MNINTFQDTFISKIDIKGKPIYVKLLWKPNENNLFHIKVYDGQSSWSGYFSHDFAEKFMERVDENLVEYSATVKKCLSNCDGEFIYEFAPVLGDSKSAAFSWKKRLEGAIIVHGSVPVHVDDTLESKDTLIDFLMLENKLLKQSVKECNMKNNELSGDLEKCKIEMDKFMNIKTSLESSLYGKFVQLLNTKKRRIHLLEEYMQKFELTTNTIGDNELD